MGRIKQTMVKRTAENLMKESIDFDTTFEHNKRILGRTMPSKKIRNKIAGYVARLKRAELQPRKIRQKPTEEEMVRRDDRDSY